VLTFHSDCRRAKEIPGETILRLLSLPIDLYPVDFTGFASSDQDPSPLYTTAARQKWFVFTVKLNTFACGHRSMSEIQT
jgi:hypothetical protein